MQGSGHINLEEFKLNHMLFLFSGMQNSRVRMRMMIEIRSVVCQSRTGLGTVIIDA